MTEPETARVLVEGGPVHRHLSRWLAVLTGLVIGVLPVLGWAAVEALNASNGIQVSRRQQCEKANDRHRKAIPQTIALIRNGKPPPSSAERKAQGEAVFALEHPHAPPPTKAGKAALRQIDGFIDIIAPHYDCRKY